MPALNEVFGVSASIPKYTYVDRSGLDNRFKYGLQRDAHIVLHGGSKQGKTVLRRANLPETSSSVVQCRATTTCTQIYEQVLADIGVSIVVNTTTTSSKGVEAGGKTGGTFGSSLFGSLKAEASLNATTDTSDSESRQSLATGVDNLKFVSESINRSGKRPIIEDFHYMPEEERRSWASPRGLLGHAEHPHDYCRHLGRNRTYFPITTGT